MNTISALLELVDSCKQVKLQADLAHDFFTSASLGTALTMLKKSGSLDQDARLMAEVAVAIYGADTAKWEMNPVIEVLKLFESKFRLTK